MLLRIFTLILFALPVSAQTVEQVQLFSQRANGFLVMAGDIVGRLQTYSVVSTAANEAYAGIRTQEAVISQLNAILAANSGLGEEAQTSLSSLNLGPVGHGEYDRVLAKLEAAAADYPRLARIYASATQQLIEALEEQDVQKYRAAFDRIGEGGLIDLENGITVNEAVLAMTPETSPQHGVTRAWLAQLRATKEVYAVSRLPVQERLAMIRQLANELPAAATEIRSAIADAELRLAEIQNLPLPPEADLAMINGTTAKEVLAKIASLMPTALSVENLMADEFDLMSALFQRLGAGESSQAFMEEISESDRRFTSLLRQRAELAVRIQPLLKALSPAEL